MTAEGRLSRGKANYEAGKWLDNPETQEYIATIPAEETKPKESKNVKPKSR